MILWIENRQAPFLWWTTKDDLIESPEDLFQATRHSTVAAPQQVFQKVFTDPLAFQTKNKQDYSVSCSRCKTGLFFSFLEANHLSHHDMSVVPVLAQNLERRRRQEPTRQEGTQCDCRDLEGTELFVGENGKLVICCRGSRFFGKAM